MEAVEQEARRETEDVYKRQVRTIAAETLYTFEHAILPRCQIALSADEKD